MLTLFTTAKPFKGHFAVIQKNARRTWTLLVPDVEIILFGNDQGSAEAAKELGLRHEADVQRNKHGTNLVNCIFERAERIARHDLVCYVNCDIILTRDFRLAAGCLLPWGSRFLMVGRRWDVDVTEPLDFSLHDWGERITNHARIHGYQRADFNIDYFLFTKGLYQEIPPFAIGRRAWDTWLVWKAHELGAPVVDASGVVCAVHQNHDYSHHSLGMEGVWEGEESRRNLALMGGHSHLCTIGDATYRLTTEGPVRNKWYWLAPAKRRLRSMKRSSTGWVRTYLWHPLLDATRSVRHAIGLKKDAIPKAFRSKQRRHWMDW